MSKIFQMLKTHEAVSKFAYTCPGGKLTVGVGRNVDPDGGLGLSNDEVDYLLRNDVYRTSIELTKNFAWFSALCPARRDALIDICFNLGLTRLKKFKKALGAMAKGDYILAAKEFMDSNWSRQVGQRAITVTTMIETGEYLT